MGQVQLKPFSVTMGYQPTDWWAELTILEELREKGRNNWTEEESRKYNQLRSQAGSWVTCACGNQCSIIPRDGDTPQDEILRTEGSRFYQRVARLDTKGAAFTLEKIEKRSEKLIKNILKNATTI